MEYKGYSISEGNNSVFVEGVRDFDPVHTFECGQCFRWIKEKDGSYTGVVAGKVGNINYSSGRLEIKNSSINDFKGLWFDYLDLGRDYTEIKRKLLKDKNMEKAIAFGHGIRLLKQDFWETLISFIISANNRIPRIMQIVDTISHMYGSQILFNGDSYYTFPDSEKLMTSDLEQLKICRAGFRCKYILETTRFFQKGVVDCRSLKEMDRDEARNQLVRFSGVGNKVADCTLLYSGIKYNVFPTDVWVMRVMEELYFKRKTSFKEIQAFVDEYFGELAGFAQQYLFYYARENKIGV